MLLLAKKKRSTLLANPSFLMEVYDILNTALNLETGSNHRNAQTAPFKHW